MLGARAIPAASMFSVQASTGDKSSQDASNPPVRKQVASDEEQPILRQEATVSGSSRPPRATESATGPLPDDPDLATVVAAWPELPELPEGIRGEIVTMVNATLKAVDPRQAPSMVRLQSFEM
jgi:hypothetical protein